MGSNAQTPKPPHVFSVKAVLCCHTCVFWKLNLLMIILFCTTTNIRPSYTALRLGRMASGGAAAATAYAKRAAEAAARIFGNWIGNGERSGRKILRRNLLGDKLNNYYAHIASPVYDGGMVESESILKQVPCAARRHAAPDFSSC